MISSIFRKTGKIKKTTRGIFLSCMEVQRKKPKGSPHIMTSFALKERKHSLRMIGILFSDQRSKIILKQGDPSAYKPPLISSYYQYLLRSPWSDIRLTTISAMSYMPYFIAFMHRFYCTFCVHFFHNSEFQQIIVVICSFSLLLFLECRCTI